MRRSASAAALLAVATFAVAQSEVYSTSESDDGARVETWITVSPAAASPSPPTTACNMSGSGTWTATKS